MVWARLNCWSSVRTLKCRLIMTTNSDCHDVHTTAKGKLLCQTLTPTRNIFHVCTPSAWIPAAIYTRPLRCKLLHGETVDPWCMGLGFRSFQKTKSKRRQWCDKELTVNKQNSTNKNVRQLDIFQVCKPLPLNQQTSEPDSQDTFQSHCTQDSRWTGTKLEAGTG